MNAISTAPATPALIQRRKLNQPGSLVNHMYGNNRTVPVVGEGATHLGYSDRDPWHVTSVSADGKTITLREATAKLDCKPGEGFLCNNWIITPGGPEASEITLVYRYGSWKKLWIDGEGKKRYHGEQSWIFGRAEKHYDYEF